MNSKNRCHTGLEGLLGPSHQWEGPVDLVVARDLQWRAHLLHVCWLGARVSPQRAGGDEYLRLSALL